MAAILTSLLASAISLSVRDMRHVTFEDIPATSYQNDGAALVAKVDKSASFLLLPFDQPRSVREVRFAWSSDGMLAVPDMAAEKTKAGDDFLLRIGLIVSGKAPMVPFFAPAWIKAIADSMPHTSDRMLYLVVGAKHPVGARWESPFSDGMELLAVGGARGDDGYEIVKAVLPEPLAIVGLWIMADADQTKGSFTVKLRDLSVN